MACSGSGTEAEGLDPGFGHSLEKDRRRVVNIPKPVSSSARWNFRVWGCYKVEVLKLPSSTAKLKVCD